MSSSTLITSSFTTLSTREQLWVSHVVSSACPHSTSSPYRVCCLCLVTTIAWYVPACTLLVSNHPPSPSPSCPSNFLCFLYIYRVCIVCADSAERPLPHAVLHGNDLWPCCTANWSFSPQFSWTHITLFLFGSPAYLIMQNTFESIFWFLLPVSLVVCNDISAYLFGK